VILAHCCRFGSQKVKFNRPKEAFFIQFIRPKRFKVKWFLRTDLILSQSLERSEEIIIEAVKVSTDFDMRGLAACVDAFGTGT
jgi:hypothetical protein